MHGSKDLEDRLNMSEEVGKGFISLLGFFACGGHSEVFFRDSRRRALRIAMFDVKSPYTILYVLTSGIWIWARSTRWLPAECQTIMLPSAGHCNSFCIGFNEMNHPIGLFDMSRL